MLTAILFGVATVVLLLILDRVIKYYINYAIW
jgi:hypothetical protein